MQNFLRIKTPGGSFSAYIARPNRAEPAPAIVVIQEIFGVNADMRETCDAFAADGFLAVCPDLFWRMQPAVDLNDGNEKDWKAALSLYQAFDAVTGIADIAAALSAARGIGSGRVGIVGYCLGGLMVFQIAARNGADAAVAYYGGGIEKHLEEAAALATPLMVHLGEKDEYISKDAQRRIQSALEYRPRVQVYTYPGCHHAFARHRGQHYSAACADTANTRTLHFFRDYLT
jgi:carboxymethylenebutenolidase